MWALWLRGFDDRKSFVMVASLPLSQHDQARKLCEPMPVRPGDQFLSLDLLARLYPLATAPTPVVIEKKAAPDAP